MYLQYTQLSRLRVSTFLYTLSLILSKKALKGKSWYHFGKMLNSFFYSGMSLQLIKHRYVIYVITTINTI